MSNPYRKVGKGRSIRTVKKGKNYRIYDVKLGKGKSVRTKVKKRDLKRK